MCILAGPTLGLDLRSPRVLPPLGFVPKAGEEVAEVPGHWLAVGDLSGLAGRQALEHREPGPGFTTTTVAVAIQACQAPQELSDRGEMLQPAGRGGAQLIGEHLLGPRQRLKPHPPESRS